MVPRDVSLSREEAPTERAAEEKRGVQSRGVRWDGESEDICRKRGGWELGG